MVRSTYLNLWKVSKIKMFTIPQILAHVIGDYFIQSDWMALNKQQKSIQGWLAVTVHAITYTLPFLLITRSPLALAIICVSHLLIDHFKLASYICWAKNFFAPKSWWHPWSKCKDTFGYHPDRPVFITIWLMIIVDNTIHIIINGLSIYYLG